jgi:type III secretory pathway component EscU
MSWRRFWEDFDLMVNTFIERVMNVFMAAVSLLGVLFVVVAVLAIIAALVDGITRGG